MKRILSAITLIAASLTLAACGGGGGGSSSSGPVTSTLTFPFQSAYQTATATGFTKNFTISGDCGGSGTDTEGPATTSTTFEGAPALSAGNATTWTFTGCTPTSNAVTSTTYYDASYIPLGYSGSSYGVFLTPANLPTTVKVGDTGIVGTETLYTDSSKGTGDGRIDFSYVIEADTSTTAIVNVIQKEYNAASTLTSTGQSRYRISQTGPLTPVSLDIQANIHVLWTYH